MRVSVRVYAGGTRSTCGCTFRAQGRLRLRGLAAQSLRCSRGVGFDAHDQHTLLTGTRLTQRCQGGHGDCVAGIHSGPITAATATVASTG